MHCCEARKYSSESEISNPHLAKALAEKHIHTTWRDYYLPRTIPEEMARDWLPCGTQVVTEAGPGRFLVDDGADASSRTRDQIALGYRVDPKVEAKSLAAYVRLGRTVSGSDVGNGWIKVKHRQWAYKLDCREDGGCLYFMYAWGHANGRPQYRTPMPTKSDLDDEKDVHQEFQVAYSKDYWTIVDTEKGTVVYSRHGREETPPTGTWQGHGHANCQLIEVPVDPLPVPVKGSKGFILGLTSASGQQLNGRIADVITDVNSNGRVGICVDGEEKSLKASCVFPLRFEARTP